MDCVLGDYRLLEKVGAGGMGEVWRAENVHTRVVCAVKLLPVEAASDRNFVARFFDEGRLMQTLDHPHIVRVHHVGHDEKSGRYYLVMDFVEGPDGSRGRSPSSVNPPRSPPLREESSPALPAVDNSPKRAPKPQYPIPNTEYPIPSSPDSPQPRKAGYPCSLHDMLAQTPNRRLPEREVARWARQVAEALAYAHSQGVVHRDIKPANVMVDRAGNARVTDFGLAKAIGETYLQSQIHTSIAQSMGGGSVNSLKTRRNAADAGAAPERSIGELPTLDSDRDKAGGGRSSADALLGTYDYMAPEQRGDIAAAVTPASDIYAFGVMLYRLLTGRRPTGMAKPVSQAVPGLSKKWDRLCARCLEHDPADRYADGAELCRDMRGIEGLAEMRRARRGRRYSVLGVGYWVLGIGVAAALVVAAHWSYQSYRSHQSHLAQAAAQDAALQAKVTELRTAAETALAAGDLERAGAKIAELRNAGGPTSVSAELQKRYEAKAGERETNKRYAAASLAKERTDKLDRDQGFGARLDALEVTWREAEAARQGGGWGQALSGYDAVIAACRTLEALEVARGDAEARRGEAEQARRDAAGANAAEDAKEMFETGGRASSRAAEAFEKVDFPAATKAWQEATTSFVAAKTRSLAVQAYRQAKTDFEAALAADETGTGGRASPRATLLGKHGGPKWQEVQREQRIGAASAADPVEGKRAYAAALAMLPAAVAEALDAEKTEAEQVHQARVAASLAAARAAKAAGQWQECLEKAGEIYDLETGGRASPRPAVVAEANALKREAEQNLVPTLMIVAVTEAGREIEALASAAGKTWKTPATIPLAFGQAYDFTVTHAPPNTQYQIPNTQYLPSTLLLTADWRGPQTRRVTLKEARGPVEGRDWTSPATGMEFVWVSALKVWVGQYEVTNGEYRKKEADHDSKSCDGHSLNGDRQPVVYVNFDDARTYAAWLTERDKEQLGGMRYRVISEQEWQTAAQCGDGREYPWGNAMPPKWGNYHGSEGAGSWSKISGYTDGYAVTCPVEKSGANEWGIHGLGGNVWECCASDASGVAFGAWRGASWDNGSPGSLRCAYRGGGDGAGRVSYSGFRLALSR